MNMQKTRVRTKDLLFIALFAAFTCIGAFIKIPMAPVSISLQLFFMALAGIMLGPKKGAVSQLVYVLVGLLGLPVFTMGGGLSYVFYPSFGYLIGLIPAAYIIGALTRNKMTPVRVFLSCLAGFAVLYAFGASYLYMIQNLYLHKDFTVWQSLYSGIIIFLPGDMIKIFALCLNARHLSRIRIKL